MAKLAQFETDLDKELAGVWVDYDDGIRLLVARIGNPKYAKLIKRLRKPHERRLARADLDSDLLTGLIQKAMASTVLLGWENITEDQEDEEGNIVEVEVPYSAEKALDYLTNPKLRDFYADVLTFATQQENYLQDAEEALVGNSSSVSSGI